ncbi:hypothetical protein P4C99_20105 [Pontiellaceae bacterium B1224]|nr:hypothetical protein [Pontiellaceae bacterium B1224]
MGKIVDAMFPGLDMPVEGKAEVLEKLLWLFRVSRNRFADKIDFETVVESKLLVSDDQISITMPKESTQCDKGTRPVQYQPPLLWHLLLTGGNEEPVFDTISTFIHRYYTQLQIEDFKKTDTGVIRCFTNTRFAAKTLREYGFLRFGRHDLFKHWKLSFPGLLAAGHFYLYPPPKSDEPGQNNWHGLYKGFSNIISYYSDYEHCLDTLCKLFDKSEGAFGSYEDLIQAFCCRSQQYYKDLYYAKTRKDGLSIAGSWVTYIDSLSDRLGFTDEFALDMQLQKFEIDWFKI